MTFDPNTPNPADNSPNGPPVQPPADVYQQPAQPGYPGQRGNQGAAAGYPGNSGGYPNNTGYPGANGYPNNAGYPAPGGQYMAPSGIKYGYDGKPRYPGLLLGGLIPMTVLTVIVVIALLANAADMISTAQYFPDLMVLVIWTFVQPVLYAVGVAAMWMGYGWGRLVLTIAMGIALIVAIAYRAFNPLSIIGIALVGLLWAPICTEYFKAMARFKSGAR